MGRSGFSPAGLGRELVSNVHLLALLLLFAGGGPGCAARAPSEDAGPTPESLLRELPARNLTPAEQLAYRFLEERILYSGGRVWAVLPRSVLALGSGFVEYSFGEGDGLLGPVLCLDYDSNYIWLGTAGGLNVIDTFDLTLHAYAPADDTTDTYIHELSTDGEGDVWVVTRNAVCWINTVGRTWKDYPFRGFVFSDLREVLFDGTRIWLATRQGLRRFSRDWRAWDAVPGSRELAKIDILGVEKDERGRLWALTAQGLYFYDPDFDSWKFTGR